MNPGTQAYDLTLDNVTHRYGSGAVAVDHVTLEIKGGELVALLGPSGCGKTTLLRIIAGFVNQSEGRVVIGGRPIEDMPPNRREVGVVFQNYALFPHMTVGENVAYGLAARGIARDEQAARVVEMLSLVKMQSFAERYPKQLSGGQQQRVALARALAVKPRILLLDEPFAALDKNLRLDMQIEVKRIQRLAGITTIMVTHDQEEALSMADRIAVLNQGRLEQFGSATEVYDSPATLFVNQFVGTANMLPGRFDRVDADGARVLLDIGTGIDARPLAKSIEAGAPVMACVRPESLRFSEDADAIAGTVELGLLLGPLVVHEIRLADGRFVKIAEPRAPGTPQHASGTPVRIKPVSRSAVSVFPAPH